LLALLIKEEKEVKMIMRIAVIKLCNLPTAMEKKYFFFNRKQNRGLNKHQKRKRS